MRRFASAAIALMVIVGFLAAGEYTGYVTSVSKDEVKVTVGRKKGEKGTEKVLKAKGLKVMKGEEEVKADDVEKMIADSKGKLKGFNAKLYTEGEGDAEMVTKIVILGKKKDK